MTLAMFLMTLIIGALCGFWGAILWLIAIPGDDLPWTDADDEAVAAKVL